MPLSQVLINEEEQQPLLEPERREALLNETKKMAKVGGWEYDLLHHTIFWDAQVYAIYGLPESIEPNLDMAIAAYPAPYNNIVREAVDRAIAYKESFEFDVQLKNSKGQVVWVHAQGKPLADASGKVISLFGTLQDIDEQKRKQLELQESLHIISKQNKRLLNFAYIVSHNLRSHSGNLTSLLGLLGSAEDEEEKKLFLQNIHNLSGSLSQTIEHLTDVVGLQPGSRMEKKLVFFEEVFDDTISILAPTIAGTNTVIDADFSQCPVIEYLPAYLESILLNLLSNGIKYRHPSRSPEITIRSFSRNGNHYLTVEDNGMGIDLNKYKDKLFGMYKTFHHNKDARGIGLFITRNQVEAMGGSIDVEGEVNKGTRFTVQF